MNILGIHDGHNAGAAVLQNGVLVAAVSEERLSGLKNDPGYPARAVAEVLALAGLAPSDLDAVVLATRFLHRRDFYLDWDWYHKGLEDQRGDAGMDAARLDYFQTRRTERVRAVVDHIGVNPDRIQFVEHHEGHAATAYFGSPWAGSDTPVLVLTLDGSGDGLCASVSTASGGVLSRVTTTGRDASLGKIYSRITYLLGMRPWEHEYKLMGMAPYADQAGVDRALAVLRPLIRLDGTGLSFECGTELSANYCYPYLREHLERIRFDHVAGGIQALTEELVVQWVESAVKATGIRRVACAGGVFMNVKANLRILQSPHVDELFVFPSCGDESLSIGAAYLAHARHPRGDARGIAPLGSLYLGREWSVAETERAALDAGARHGVRVSRPGSVPDAVARLLADGEIVARCSGRMEWGARGLGNRSILMDPRRLEGVQTLNAAIKHRDFWMPFAPTVMAEAQHELLVNPGAVRSPYMVLSMDTTPLGSRQMGAAVHPYDRTARPQILEQAANPEYHATISAFRALTGVGAVLNTSFNLHGEPVVHGPQEALSAFMRSGLQHLVLGHLLIQKPEAGA